MLFCLFIAGDSTDNYRPFPLTTSQRRVTRVSKIELILPCENHQNSTVTFSIQRHDKVSLKKH
jgi:hypothetical protein